MVRQNDDRILFIGPWCFMLTDDNCIIASYANKKPEEMRLNGSCVAGIPLSRISVAATPLGTANPKGT